MRNVMKFSVLAGLLALPLGALAQIPTIGTVIDPGTGAPTTAGSAGDTCELYSVKSDGGLSNDWQAELVARGGGFVGMGDADFDLGLYQVLGGNFDRPEAPTNVVAVFVTCDGGLLHFDSGLLGTFNFMGQASIQTIGNSYTGSLTLPGDGTAYQVDFGAGGVDFPAVGADAGGTVGQSINYAFAPFAELNDVDQGGWSWGGAAADPGSPLPDGGFIVGYNVYRMEDAGGAPDVATLGAMANWVGFVPMNFDMTVGDTGAGGVDAPADGNAAGDFAGMQNADAAAYTGDEVLLFQDGAQTARDGATLNPNAADPTLVYWYAVQPVVRGAVADFTAVNIAGQGVNDYTIMGGNAVDLDLDGTPEFWSPNEAAGINGLGLTWNNLPLLSPVAQTDPARLPATGYLGLDVEMGRRGVELSLNAALEAGNVLGYNVYRLAGESRELVNESLIAARGGNGNSYSIVDDRFAGRRARTLAYEVEVVYNDGSDAGTFGPFEAETATRGSARRSR